MELDESSYGPKGMPTIFHQNQLPHGLSGFEDPRLLVHRGELYMLAYGYVRSAVYGYQYLARLERLPAASPIAGSADPAAPPAGFRLVQPRRLLLPEDIPAALTLPAGISDLIRKPRPHWEKNWVPFTHDDSIHFLHSVNPPVALRVVADPLGANSSADIRTEFVSVGGNVSVRWRYGVMRGSTPAVYDAALGGYIALFHSSYKFEGASSPRYYFMGVYVFAAQPPFSIQLVSQTPLVGAGFYDESKANTQSRIIFPVGLLVLPNGDFVVSYGKDDSRMRVARFDRRKLMQTLQAPLPESWEGPPC
jgi:hypothetical protein